MSTKLHFTSNSIMCGEFPTCLNHKLQNLAGVCSLGEASGIGRLWALGEKEGKLCLCKIAS